MKKILTLNLGAGNTVANSVTVLGAEYRTVTNTVIYNTAQLLDNLNVPLSPLVDVRTSIYDDTAGKRSCNVFYKLDPSVINAATYSREDIDKKMIPLSIHTSVGGSSDPSAALNGTSAQFKDNSHTLSYDSISIEDFRNIIFGVKACKHDGDLIVGFSGDRPTGADLSNYSEGNCRFTYDFNQRALYKPFTGSPNNHYIWIAWPVDNEHVLHKDKLGGVKHRFAEVKGYSGSDSPQAIEFTFQEMTVDRSDVSVNYIVGISDSRFGVGLPYNIIVKPAVFEENGAEEYYID